MEAGGHMSQLQLPILRRLSEVMLEKQLTSHKVDRSICGWFWDYVVSQGGDSTKLNLLEDSFAIILLGGLSLLEEGLKLKESGAKDGDSIGMV
ncbi:hypothetical protein HPP92_028086 [Vanilla planifolia]|uniref:Uncharacterized protein n=1 Tax=Vanilla planifolia TaxID=51239 RepID=A0A835P9F1_VANPL|nr:hypothetical protein HPP92_028086 [Vanilla planifolia]